MQDLGKEEEHQPAEPAEGAELTDVKQAWNVAVFFQRIVDVVIWQMKDGVKPEEDQPEEEKAAVDEEAQKTIDDLSKDIFFTCIGTLNCFLYLV